MGKRIIIYIFLSVVFIQYLFSQENIDDYNEQSRQIVSNFLSSQNKEEKQKTLDALYQAISSDKIINKEKIPNLRLSIYVRIFLTIKNNHELSLDKRQELLDVLADGIVNEGIVKDNTLYLRERNVKFLYELVYERKIQDLTSLCVKNIENACVQLLHDPRYAVLLLSVSGSKRANKLLQEFADSPRLNLERMYYSKTWAATLILAQKGEEKYVKQLIRLSEKSIEANPGMMLLLFRDLPTVHDKMVVRYLHEYLKSDKRAPEWDDGVTEPQYVSYYAALALSKMLRGFPAPKSYFNMEAVEDCRQWMAEQKEYMFLETP
jgi:hypothetical protein